MGLFKAALGFVYVVILKVCLGLRSKNKREKQLNRKQRNTGEAGKSKHKQSSREAKKQGKIEKQENRNPKQKLKNTTFEWKCQGENHL